MKNFQKEIQNILFLNPTSPSMGKSKFSILFQFLDMKGMLKRATNKRGYSDKQTRGMDS